MKSKLVIVCAIALTVLIVCMVVVHPVQAHEFTGDTSSITKPSEDETPEGFSVMAIYSGNTATYAFSTILYVSNKAYVDKKASIIFDGKQYAFMLADTYDVQYQEYRVGSSQPFGWTVHTAGAPFADSNCSVSAYVPIFSTREQASNYFSTGDYTGALNYDDLLQLEEDNRKFTYDGDYPYFDRSAMVVNKNNTVTYNASMSEEQRNRYYDLLAMEIDKDGTGTGSHRIAYMEYYCTAVYADSSQLGIFNNYMLQYGSRDTGFINTSKLPNANKIDEIIQFDTNGRLKVSGYYGIQGHKHSSGFSGFLGNSPFAWSDNSALVAVELDSATPSDKLTVSPSFQKLLQSDDKITDITQYGPLLGGATSGVKNYTLVGYACDVRIVVLEDNEYKYSKDTYTYTWLNSAMRDRYGASTSTYDDDGNKSPDSYYFDGNGEEIDGMLNNGFEYNMSGIQGFIKSGFRLLDSNGFLSLIAGTMSFIPAWVWIVVQAIVASYASFLLFKLLLKAL